MESNLVSIYVLVNHALWKRRCTFIFENRMTPDDVFMSNVKNEFRRRLLVDFKRWSREKFKKIWVEGSSIVTMEDAGPVLHIA